MICAQKEQPDEEESRLRVRLQLQLLSKLKRSKIQEPLELASCGAASRFRFVLCSLLGGVWECLGMLRRVSECLEALHISRAAVVRFAEKLRGWVLHRTHYLHRTQNLRCTRIP